MTGLGRTALHRTGGGRLLALLLIVLLAAGSLSSHAQAPADPLDCPSTLQATPQETGGLEAPHCPTCTAMTPALPFGVMGDAETAITPLAPFSDHALPPPKRPPRT